MTCILETFATLRIFSGDLSPEAIEKKFGVKATSSHNRDPKSRYRSHRDSNRWSWCTEQSVDSLNTLCHINRVIEQFNDKALELEALRSMGCTTDICSYMVTTGQGGPQLNLQTMRSLCCLGLTIWWDVYKGEEEDYKT